MHRKRQPEFFKLSICATKIQSIKILSTLYVIILGEQIHPFRQLVNIDEGTCHDDRAEKALFPIGADPDRTSFVTANSKKRSRANCAETL